MKAELPMDLDSDLDDDNNNDDDLEDYEFTSEDSIEVNSQDHESDISSIN